MKPFGIADLTAPLRPASGIFELRQMPSRIVSYRGTTSSPAGRDFATLNLLICLPCEMRSLFLRDGNLDNRSTQVKITKNERHFFNLHVNNLAENFSLKTRQFPSKPKIPTHDPDFSSDFTFSLTTINTSLYPGEHFS